MSSLIFYQIRESCIHPLEWLKRPGPSLFLTNFFKTDLSPYYLNFIVLIAERSPDRIISLLFFGGKYDYPWSKILRELSEKDARRWRYRV
jgi:hypothetical protein